MDDTALEFDLHGCIVEVLLLKIRIILGVNSGNSIGPKHRIYYMALA